MLLAIIILVIIVFIIIRVVGNDKGNENSNPSYAERKDSDTVVWADRYSSKASHTGRIGENAVSFILCSLPQEYLVVNDVIIPDQTTVPGEKHTTQIDHIVVSPYGIFVIETKNYSGWIFGSEESKRWKETFRTTQGSFFYNPIKQNWGHAYALAEHLQLDIRLFKPIVVFSDICELHVEATTPVVHMSQLKGLILDYRQEMIPRDDVAFIFNRLRNLSIVGEAVENRHIQSIGERLTEKEMAMRNGRCPRCGGELKLRSGRFGSFYGCSNYPKCRFTCNTRS